MIQKFKTSNAEETISLGKEIGASCVGGEVFLLLGDLGAGKTCLSQGIAKGLGVKTKVNSPTFNIMKIYEGKKLSLCHIDAYRLDSGHDLTMIGLDDYLNRKNLVVIIEWAEKVKDIWPKKKIKIEIKTIKDGRQIKVC